MTILSYYWLKKMFCNGFLQLGYEVPLCQNTTKLSAIVLLNSLYDKFLAIQLFKLANIYFDFIAL